MVPQHLKYHFVEMLCGMNKFLQHIQLKWKVKKISVDFFLNWTDLSWKLQKLIWNGENELFNIYNIRNIPKSIEKKIGSKFQIIFDFFNSLRQPYFITKFFANFCIKLCALVCTIILCFSIIKFGENWPIFGKKHHVRNMKECFTFNII